MVAEMSGTGPQDRSDRQASCDGDSKRESVKSCVESLLWRSLVTSGATVPLSVVSLIN